LRILILIISFYITTTQAIVPENDLWIGPEAHKINSITEKEFNEVLDLLEEIYIPMVAAKDAKLIIERDWKNGKVNAGAIRNGKYWRVYMYGGLARHETITKDALALVACHEIGHHLAGAPHKGAFYESTSWASNEGQADYFATAKCMRKYLQRETSFQKINPEVTAKCSQTFSHPQDLRICQRGALAGLSLANLFRTLRGSIPIRFDTPDPKVVSTTYDKHPDPQCRLDTYFNGAICEKDHIFDFSDIFPDDVRAACTRKEGLRFGMRPLCWYRPDRT